jgi:eukaryotic-like serine/threonine-protein kinase
LIDVLTRLQTALADRYRIQRDLGRGGMATVYLVHDLHHKRNVALKLFRPELAATIGPERFLREIETAARLQHPHILPVFDSGEARAPGSEAPGLLWYTMPYVEGESLRDRLRREVQLPVDEAIRIAREVALALNYAHRQGVVHRDIKPENVLLSEGQALVSDFGVAWVYDAATAAKLTESGMVVGTPAYMSPEQAAAGQVDGRSDIYSLGCVLYELLAGEPPHTGPTAQALMSRRLTESPRPLRAVRETVPESVEAAVTQALAKVPADRFATAAEFAAALAAPTASAVPRAAARPSSRSSNRLWLWGGAALALVALGALVLRGGASRSPIVPSASVIAVLPLAPTEPDTGLVRLGRDLAATVSANLDGVGSIRTVDRLTVLAQTRGQAGYSLEDGAALARRLGASSVVLGSVVGAGRQVRADLGLYRTDSLLPLARAQVTADPENINALTDSITWALLRQIWRTGGAPTPSLAAVTTRSVPALRAFLEGEREIVESRWQKGAEAYHRAMEADSTFWLAYWRYAYAKDWNFEEYDSSVTRALRDHRNALPEQERLLIEGFTSESVSVQLARYRQVTERFPDNWLGWMYYADALVHWAPGLGFTNADAKVALERTLTLNPNLLPAWEHLGWMALALRDTVASARVIRALEDLRAAPSFKASTGFDELRLFRILHQVASTGAPDRAALDSLVGEIARHPNPFWQGLFPWLITSYGFPQLQIAVSRRVLRAGPPAEVMQLQRRGIAVTWATRGAWDSAMTAMDEYRALYPDGGAGLDRYRLAVAGAWLGAVEPAEAARRRPGGKGVAVSAEPAERAELAWLDGVLAATRRNQRALVTARETIAKSGDSVAADLDVSLAAFELAMKGRRRQAADQLAALMWRRADGVMREGESHPFLGGVSRLAAARWLLQEGDTVQAARLLTWHDGWIANPTVSQADLVLGSPAILEAARIDEARGRAANARTEYERFLRLYDLPVASQRSLVDEARQAVRR